MTDADEESGSETYIGQIKSAVAVIRKTSKRPDNSKAIFNYIVTQCIQCN